jgi:hypothetical protein
MRRVDRDLVADRDARHRGAEPGDHARCLVAGDQRLAHRERADPAVLEVVQVGAADAAGAELQLDVVRAELGRCFLLEAQVPGGVDAGGNRHGVLLRRSCARRHGAAFSVRRRHPRSSSR